MLFVLFPDVDFADADFYVGICHLALSPGKTSFRIVFMDDACFCAVLFCRR